ncbi:uncharacterized protein PAC_06681 [Phialocephala subalpina]|uniref:G-protein coupled receptors family 2 profile 2 domain-containing protein n=1 Tax=Phialocephala subalpina TaxID=576137 RepID=A0A1L7WVI3_9HELO|nr:uncharacterized protein PAC_06681 [Phialocephala subalpina]
MVLLTEKQTETIVAIERSMGFLSVFCSLLLLTTFLLFKEFRNVGNTMIFMATPANLIANSAATIGMLGLKNPGGPLCQFQAFALEWFEQSDPYWCCAASITVLLIFYRRISVERIKKFWWLYCLLCYGLPFIPAITFLFYRDRNGPIYGYAIIWCFIGQTHAWDRIYSFYGPVWVMAIASLLNYFLVGVHVFRARSQLHAAKKANQTHLNQAASLPSTGTSTESRPQHKPIITSPTLPTPLPPSPRIQTPPRVQTPIIIQTPPRTHDLPRTHNSSRFPIISRSETPHSSRLSESIDRTLVNPPKPPKPLPPIQIHVSTTYSVEYSEKPLPELPSADSPDSPDSSKLRPDEGIYDCAISSEPFVRRRSCVEAFLDFVVDVLEWIPKALWAVKESLDKTVDRVGKTLNRWEKMDKVKYRYTQTAMLFTASILITWIPSSTNRVYGIIHPTGPLIYSLNIATAVVLPLQGFWNALIFFSTSLPTVKQIYHEFRTGKRHLSDSFPSPSRSRRDSVGTVNIPLSERGGSRAASRAGMESRTGSRLGGVDSRMGGRQSRAGGEGEMSIWDVV